MRTDENTDLTTDLNQRVRLPLDSNCLINFAISMLTFIVSQCVCVCV